MINRPAGFTLIELIVVITIIGILAAFAVPQYMNSLEVNKADDAVALVNMVATTNRMYALDHNGTYLAGVITNACNNEPNCPATTTGPQCSLVSCKYLAATDWDSKPYVLSAASGLGLAALASRRTSGTGSTSSSPYNQWGYAVSQNGVITCCNPSCSASNCGGSGNPPTPTQ